MMAKFPHSTHKTFPPNTLKSFYIILGCYAKINRRRHNNQRLSFSLTLTTRTKSLRLHPGVIELICN